MNFLNISAKHIGLWVWLKPGSKKDAILGFGPRGFEISVKARAVEGEANLAMIALLATFLDKPKTSISLVKGKQSRQKYLELPYDEAVVARLNFQIR